MPDTVITQAFSPDDEGVFIAAKALAAGGLAVIPTETVYGLAANALDGRAVEKIFIAKGRPQDNPLIVHIADISELYRVAREVPPEALILASKFWPGPLTMLFKKSDAVPLSVTAGLDTVAVRFPKNEIARAIIKASGVPLAAPSANISGRPSITSAKYCREELSGRVDVIVESFDCTYGVESTVVALSDGSARILRPGAVTLEQLRDTLGSASVDPAVLRGLSDGEKAASPGMKYKHYAPKAEITVIDADKESYISFMRAHPEDFALCFDEDAAEIKNAVSYGSESDALSMAHRLFDALRKLDEVGAKTVYARKPPLEEIGLAVYNRLLRAAAFREVSLAKNRSEGVRK